jgi:hypothetical protein
MIVKLLAALLILASFCATGIFVALLLLWLSKVLIYLAEKLGLLE